MIIRKFLESNIASNDVITTLYSVLMLIVANGLYLTAMTLIDKTLLYNWIPIIIVSSVIFWSDWQTIKEIKEKMRKK